MGNEETRHGNGSWRAHVVNVPALGTGVTGMGIETVAAGRAGVRVWLNRHPVSKGGPPSVTKQSCPLTSQEPDELGARPRRGDNSRLWPEPEITVARAYSSYWVDSGLCATG